MRAAERIYEKVSALPERLQLQLLDLVEHLTSRLREEDTNWSRLSLNTALRGLEEELWPEYSEEDFKEKWQ